MIRRSLDVRTPHNGPTEAPHAPEFSRMARGSGPTQVLSSLSRVSCLCFILWLLPFS